jgi:hypothetical protein
MFQLILLPLTADAAAKANIAKRKIAITMFRFVHNKIHKVRLPLLLFFAAVPGYRIATLVILVVVLWRKI